MWPTFKVTELLPDGSLVGTVDIFTVGESTCVSDRQLGYLKLAESLFSGRWQAHDQHWRFSLDEPRTFSIGDTFSVIDIYWGERVVIATDSTLQWSPLVWTDTHDHDHCSICWGKISTTAESNYYKNSTPDSVCATCYRKHVSQRDISFVPIA